MMKGEMKDGGKDKRNDGRKQRRKQGNKEGRKAGRQQGRKEGSNEGNWPSINTFRSVSCWPRYCESDEGKMEGFGVEKMKINPNHGPGFLKNDGDVTRMGCNKEGL
jgi:hypothetical protein